MTRSGPTARLSSMLYSAVEPGRRPAPAPPVADAILDDACKGDRAAIELLLLRVAPRVRNLARYLSGGDGDADDVAQDALARVYSKLSTYRREGGFSAWVDRIVLRSALTHKSRSARRRETILEDERGPAVQASNREDYLVRRRLASALDSLPVEQRHALVLHHVLELSVPEVATEIGASPETIRSRLRLGRNKLRALLHADEEAGR